MLFSILDIFYKINIYFHITYVFTVHICVCAFSLTVYQSFQISTTVHMKSPSFSLEKVLCLPLSRVCHSLGATQSPFHPTNLNNPSHQNHFQAQQRDKRSIIARYAILTMATLGCSSRALILAEILQSSECSHQRLTS